MNTSRKIRSEADATAAVVAWLRALPGCDARKIAGTPYGGGWPDVLAVVRGQAVFIEMKRADRRANVTAAQAAALRRWAKAGAVTGVATDVRDVAQLLIDAGLVDASVMPAGS
jgi:Holliday junction resolvase